MDWLDSFGLKQNCLDPTELIIFLTIVALQLFPFVLCSKNRTRNTQILFCIRKFKNSKSCLSSVFTFLFINRISSHASSPRQFSFPSFLCHSHKRKWTNQENSTHSNHQQWITYAAYSDDEGGNHLGACCYCGCYEGKERIQWCGEHAVEFY